MLVLRVADPAKSDSSLKGARNRLIVLREPRAPESIPLAAFHPRLVPAEPRADTSRADPAADLPSDTLTAAAESLIEGLRVHPRHADSRGDVVSLDELEERLLDLDSLEEPADEALRHPRWLCATPNANVTASIFPACLRAM